MRDRFEPEENRKAAMIEEAMGPTHPYPTAAPQAAREMSEAERLDLAFTYHVPSDRQSRLYAGVRVAGQALALAILNAAPKCADRTDAIRKVREAVMTANAAIALDGLI